MFNMMTLSPNKDFSQRVSVKAINLHHCFGCATKQLSVDINNSICLA